MTKDEFKKLREFIGYTQAQLSKKMDVTIRTLTRWETGKIPISKTAELALRHIVEKAREKQKARHG